MSEQVEGTRAPVRAGQRILGKYEVERVLGQGGMGVVVKATHMALGHRVAIKFLLPEACNHPGAVERFLREARAAVQIQSEHVARVSDVGSLESGLPYMVMEYLDGNDLSEELQARGALPVPEAVSYLLEALEAIAEAHSLGIVHRDLKPANLFLAARKDGSRTLKVLDFGISKAIQEGDTDLTQTASMMGSPLYVAPEQIRNSKTVDCRADVWSLGVILHECLSGRPPFGGETLSSVLAAIVADLPEPLAEVRPDLPPQLTDIVARCLEKDPTRRVQNVAVLAQLLAPFAPRQAERSLPRIGAVLGKTLPQGTDPGLVSGLDRTVLPRDLAGQTAPGTDLPTETASGTRTAQAWTRAPDGLARRPSATLLVALAGVIGVAALLGWSLLRGPREAPDLDAIAQPSAEVEEPSQGADAPATSDDGTEQERPHDPTRAGALTAEIPPSPPAGNKPDPLGTPEASGLAAPEQAGPSPTPTPPSSSTPKAPAEKAGSAAPKSRPRSPASAPRTSGSPAVTSPPVSPRPQPSPTAPINPLEGRQ